MDTLAIDIETYSDVSLPDCGVHRYAASEQFEILLFAYSLTNRHRSLTWHPGRRYRMRSWNILPMIP